MKDDRNASVHNKTTAERIGPYTIQEFIKHVEGFHGFAAPGVIAGGFMVDMAMKRIPEGILFDAICETSSCLPDAIQLLTPCTFGNSWLTLINLGKFALTLYNKYEGSGIRVYLDPSKLDNYNEIKAWFLKLKAKKDQNTDLLLEQILLAGRNIYSAHPVQVKAYYLGKSSKGEIGICNECGEAHPVKDGSICRGCQGEAPYDITILHNLNK